MRYRGIVTDAEERALLRICLVAALADGGKTDAERERIRQIAEGFNSPDLDTSGLYGDALNKRTSTAELARELTNSETRQLAYETALGVCESDDRLNDAEKKFLAELRRELEISETAADRLHREADQLAQVAAPPVLAGATPVVTVGSSPTPRAPQTPDPALESTILNQAILAGALELLPSSLATMAIIPLQMRLVYRIGQHYGYTLDKRHIGELLATIGVGLSSQALETYATKLLKGLLGRVAGGLGRGLGGMVTGSAMSFGTTWALGQLAQRYYAGGRALSGLQLRETFQGLLTEARGMQQRYLPQIQQRSQTLNLSDVASLVGR